MDTLELLKPGIQKANDKEVGGGWVVLNASASNTKPLLLQLDAGARLTPNWAAYGKVWSEPFKGNFGGIAGMKYGNSLDLFVGATGTSKGDREINAGLAWSF